MTERRFPDLVFTPFARRSTDEHARDVAELRTLYKEVRNAHYASPFSTAEGYAEVRRNVEEVMYDVGPLNKAFSRALDTCLRSEKVIFDFPEVDFGKALSMKEHMDLSRYLRAKQHFLHHQDRVIEGLVEGYGRILGGLGEVLPKTAARSVFTVPLVSTLPEPRLFIDQIFGTLFGKEQSGLGLFADIKEALYQNLCAVTGVVPHTEHKKPWKRANDTDGPLEEVVRDYLQGTPFHDLLLTPVPLKLTYEDRFSHMHIVGGSGAGKTQLLQHLILHDLQSDDPPSLVVVDSQGDLINKLSRLALFDPDTGPLADRLVLITPKDIEHPPAINLFALNRDRLGKYDEVTKEQVTAGVIQTFDYLFAGLLGADLTAKQSVFFRFVARLMLTLPETMGRNATILDMIALMDDAGPYKPAIERLPPIQRTFFERDFTSKTFVQTKEQIRYRLNAILENPTLARLFTATETKIDFFDTLNKGGIILIDTAKDFLKGSSDHFGRLLISMVLQAVLERAVIPEHQRRPTFLIVDEAASYFDSNIDDLLTEARKYKCGCVFAHQFLDQATSALRASLAANTGIKMASGVSSSDARALASDMRTTADAILAQTRLQFACYVRNVTQSAVSVPIVAGELERQPKLDREASLKLQQQNRHKVSGRDRRRGERDDPTCNDGLGIKDRPLNSSAESARDPTMPSENW